MPSKFHLRQAAFQLKKGGIIAYPSDTIAALGALPIFLSSLNRLISYKKRGWGKGLILLCSRLNQLENFVSAEDLLELAKKINSTHFNFNQATTFLVEPNSKLPESLSYFLLGSYPKLAIRLSHNLKIDYLCNQTNLPIVSTSLNKTQQQTLVSNYQVKKRFPKLDYYLAIEKTKLKSSSIIDLASGEVIRP